MEGKEIVAQVKALVEASDAALAKALLKRDEEIKKAGEASSSTLTEVKRLEGEWRKAQADLQAEMKAATERLEKRFGRPGPRAESPTHQKSIGQRFVEDMQSDAYKGVLQQMRSGYRGSPAIIYGSDLLKGLMQKATVLSSDVTRLVAPMRDQIMLPTKRRLTLRDLMTVIQTGQNAVEYVEVLGMGPETANGTITITQTGGTATGTTNAAHGLKAGDKIELTGANQTEYVGVFRVLSTPAATEITFAVDSGAASPATGTISWRNMSLSGAAAVVEEGNAKPEARLKMTLKTAQCQTIAHWIPASRQVLDDMPTLRAMIDNELLFGLLKAEEIGGFYGAGGNGALQGILSHDNVQVQTFSTTVLDTIRKAITKVRKTDLTADVLALNPSDRERIDLAKGNDEHYLLSAVSAEVPKVWQLNILETNAIEEGDGLVGSFSQGATLYDREAGSVRFSESHASYFTSNLLAILAEERLGIAWKRPEAFVLTHLV